MAYFILENPVGPGNSRADFMPYNDFFESWISGAKFNTDPPDPIKLVWNPENEHGIRKALYTSNVVLMLKDLVSALINTGVDNLDVYPVIVRSSINGDVCEDYLAVNIIGVISAANMEESEVIDEGGGISDVLFGSLVVDENKADGHLLFRLAESANAVVIHESVMNYLEQAGDFGLSFTEPELFCG